MRRQRDTHTPWFIALGPLIAFTLSTVPVTGTIAQVARSKSSSDSASADAAYRTATGLLNRGMYDLAGDEYRRFLIAFPSDANASRARYGLAVCLSKTDKPAEAIVQLEPLIKQQGFEFAADAGLLIAQCQFTIHDYTSAAASAAALLGDHPDSTLVADARLLQGEALYFSGELKGSSLVLRWFSDHAFPGPHRERADFLVALTELSLGHDSAAAAAFASLRKAYPAGAYSGQATLYEAQSRHRLGETEPAVDLYRNASSERDAATSARAFLGLAQLLREEHDYPAAARALDGAASKDETHALTAFVQMQRGRLELDQGKHASALAAFTEILKAKRSAFTDEADYWAAQCELREKNFEGAAKRLESLLDRAPDHVLAPAAMLDLSVALDHAGHADRASTTLERLRQKYPASPLAPLALLSQASLEHRAGRFDQSTSHCEEFLGRYKDHPKSAFVSLLHAENAYFAKRPDLAEPLYERFVTLWPADEQAWRASVRRGMCLLDLHRRSEAVPILERPLLNANTRDLSLRQAATLALANAAFDDSDWSTADHFYTAYSSLAPEAAPSPGVLLRWGLSAQRSGKLQQAIEMYQRLLKGAIDADVAAQARFELGQALVETNQDDAARVALEGIAKDSSASAARFRAPAVRHLAALASRQGRIGEAADLLSEESPQTAPGSSAGSSPSDAEYERGTLLLAAGRFADADAAFERFVGGNRDDPRLTAAIAQRAIAISRQGKLTEALALLATIEPQLHTLDAELRSSALYERAWAFREIKDTERAIDAYKALLESHPTAAIGTEGTSDLAWLEYNREHYAQALALASSAPESASAPSHGSTEPVRSDTLTYLRGLCLLKLDRPAESEATLHDFDKLFPASPLLAPASLACGEAMLRSSHTQPAIEKLRRATDAVEPGVQRAAMMRLGEATATAQRWKDSEAAYIAYLDKFAGDELWFKARFGAAWACENLNRHDEAITQYRDVIARHDGPTAARAQFQIGECLFAQRKFDEAVRELLRVDILYSYEEWSAAALYEAGRCFTSLAKTAEASKQFEAVVERFGKTQWAELARQRLAELKPAPVPGASGAESQSISTGTAPAVAPR